MRFGLLILFTLTAQPTGPATLPAPDDTCKTKDDCAYEYVYLVDGKCCSGTCSPSAVAKWSEAQVKKACEGIGWEHDNCPMKKCAAPPPLECRSGHCALAAH